MGKTVRGPIGPEGPMGPPGPPGSPGVSSYSTSSPVPCPMVVPSREMIESRPFEAGSLVFLKKEEKLVLRTSDAWYELKVLSIL